MIKDISGGAMTFSTREGSENLENDTHMITIRQQGKNERLG